MGPENRLDVAVIGGGMVGLAVALGLARLGRHVTIFDEGDSSIRAARANFGLVWVQGKGEGMADYAKLTTAAANLWKAIGPELSAQAGIDVEYRPTGGLHYCLGDAELDRRATLAVKLNSELVSSLEMVSREQVQQLQPNARLGPEVSGASYCPDDAEVNPLRVLHALKRLLVSLGARFSGGKVVSVASGTPARFETPSGRYAAELVVVAAGLGSTALAEQVGLSVPMHPVKGQLVVTERVPPMLMRPGSGLRQAANGTVLIGSSNEPAEFDDRANPAICKPFVRRALQILPDLADANVVRIWAGLRTMTPDGFPIYEATTDGSVCVICCHSAVTLVPIHMLDIAAAVNAADLKSRFSHFGSGRFDGA